MTEIDTAPSQPNTARIDDIAPDFIARSTQGEVKLSDYRGRWLLFFSHIRQISHRSAPRNSCRCRRRNRSSTH